MHPHLAEVFAMIERSTDALRDAIETVPRELRRQRPAPERWSVAEIIEHLALVETIFTKRLSAPIAAARAAGVGPETGERAPLPEPTAAAMANRAVTRTAPDPMQPTGQMDDAEALAAFERAQQGFRDLLSSADGLALSTVTFDHAFFGTLNLYQWTELMAGHELRHAEQIREIAAQLT